MIRIRNIVHEHAELEELRANFPGWQISRAQVGLRIGCVARTQQRGANPRIA